MEDAFAAFAVERLHDHLSAQLREKCAQLGRVAAHDGLGHQVAEMQREQPLVVGEDALGAVEHQSPFADPQQLRRDRVEDRQPLLYSASAFHAVTFLKVADDRKVIHELRALRDAIEKPAGGLLVYAGQVAMRMVTSKQIANDWDALVLVQYPSREAFDTFKIGRAHV